MKKTLQSIKKTISRSLIFLLVANLIIIFTLVGLFYLNPNQNVLQQVKSGLQQGETGYQLDKKALKTIHKYQAWLVIYDKDTEGITYSYQAPPTINQEALLQSGDLSEETSIKSYPILTDDLGEVTLVLGFSPERYIIHKDYLVDIQFIKNIPWILAYLLVINLTLVINLFLKLVNWLSSDIKKISSMIGQIPKQVEPAEQKVVEPLSLLVKSVEHSSQNIKDQAQFQKDWLTAISHDLKTPLANIMGYSAIIKMQEDSPKNKSYSDKINHEALYIRDVIDNLLVTSQVDLDEKVPVCDVDLIDLVQKITLDQANSYNSDLHSFSFSNLTNQDIAIARTNPKLISRAIKNLTSNPVKHNPQGCDISVEFSLVNSLIQIEIKDNGQGVNPSKLAKIKNELATPIQNQTGRTSGIGLKIAYKILNHSGFILDLDSKFGAGFKVVIQEKAK